MRAKAQLEQHVGEIAVVQAPPLSGGRNHPCGVAPFRFTLSFRGLEDMLAERSIDVSHETIRRRTIKFGPPIARNLTPQGAAPAKAGIGASIVQALAKQVGATV